MKGIPRPLTVLPRTAALPALAALLAVTLSLAACEPLSAQVAAEDARLDEIARQALELRRAVEELLAPLSAEERARVEARIAELAAQRRAAPAEAAAAPASEAAPARSPAAPVVPRADATTAARPGPRPCAGLAAFDYDGDGIVSAIDRAWRHFYLWRDDGDGAVAESEVASLFDHGVRSLDASQHRYSTATGFVGDLDIGEGVGLEIPARRRGAGFERGELVVDNDGLRRAAEPTVRSARGAELPGYQPLRRGYRLVSREGLELELPCGG